MFFMKTFTDALHFIALQARFEVPPVPVVHNDCIFYIVSDSCVNTG